MHSLLLLSSAHSSTCVVVAVNYCFQHCFASSPSCFASTLAQWPRFDRSSSERKLTYGSLNESVYIFGHSSLFSLNILKRLITYVVAWMVMQSRWSVRRIQHAVHWLFSAVAESIFHVFRFQCECLPSLVSDDAAVQLTQASVESRRSMPALCCRLLIC